MQDDQDPVTLWLQRLLEGDSLAQREIWQKYSERVARQARRCMKGVSSRDSDEDDIAVRVLNSLFQRLADGRQSAIESRTELWNLLLGITRNKTADEARRKRAKKRGGGNVRGESAFDVHGEDSPGCGIAGVAGRVQDPRVAYEEAQGLVEMLESLRDSQLQQIALLKMASHTDQEIADMLKLGRRTIQRRLQELRRRFQKP